MGRKLPIGPMVSTVLAAAAANVLVAWALVGLIGRRQTVDLSPPILIGLALIAVGCTAVAITGWRTYLRGWRGE